MNIPSFAPRLSLKHLPLALIAKLMGLGVSVLIAVYLVKQIDLSQFLKALADFPTWTLVVAFAIYMALNFFRALRFHVLLGQQTAQLRLLYPIALYHNFLVRTLPFKTGEVSYIVMLRHYMKQPIQEGVVSLISARLFDLLVVASGCTIGLLTATTAITRQDAPIFTVFVPCLAVSGLCLYFSGPLLRTVLGLASRILNERGAASSRLILLIKDKLTLLASQLDRIRQPRFFVTALALSICNYAASASFSLVLLSALGVRQSFGTLLVVISLAMFAEAMPFSIAGLGLVEGGWTLGLTLFAGLSMPQAAFIAFFLHACQLISVMLSGLIGYCLLHFVTRASSVAALSEAQ